MSKLQSGVPGPASSIKDRVVKVHIKSPKTPSTRIVETLSYGWVVGCEISAECPHRVLVANAEWRPVNFADPDGPSIETRYSAPNRRFCAAHTPR